MKKVLVVLLMCLIAMPVFGQLDPATLAKAPGEYFSMKMEHLTDTLGLTQDQQTKIKPIVENETTNMTDVWGNPALSPKDKIKKWQTVVNASDQQIKPVLTGDQWTKLQQLRAEQKQKANQWLAEQKAKGKKS